MSLEMNISVPVSLTSLTAEPLTMAATLYLPETLAPGAPVLFCFPGGGYSRGYFDLCGPGLEGYSQAKFHAGEGMIVVTMDPLAVGGSSLPGDDQLAFPPGDNGARRFTSAVPFTLQSMAAGCDAGVRAVLAGLREGSLTPERGPASPGIVMGLGQSMGGHIVVMAQAQFGTFDAVAALGSSFTQTRLALRPGARRPLRNAPPERLLAAALQDSDLAATFHWPEEPEALVTVDMSPALDAPWRSRAIPRCASDLLLPGVLAREAGSVRVPVFLGYGEIDVTAEPLADVAMFRSSCDIRLSIIPGMAHMHNFAPSRRLLWRKISAFVEEMART